MNTPPRILLTSIFKPCGVDDMYGRKENIAELFHNQLTLAQGIFSIRQRFPSLGLHVIAANINAPTTILDWPTLNRFKKELEKGYDWIGISFIQPNFNKARKMVEVIREISPKSRVILGGFGTAIDGIENYIDADEVCKGEGIRFMKNLLGEPQEFTFKHPIVGSRVIRLMGVPLDMYQAMLATGLGCTYGCEFCSTSHYFKCVHIPFMRTGREIFNEMVRQETLSGAANFSLVGDENFLCDRERILELHKYMKESGKLYTISIAFASADLLNKYDPDMLAEMGDATYWIGAESKFRIFPKNKGIDMAALVKELNRWGIKTIISMILCLECHTQENIQEDIDYLISLKPTYSQFGLLSPAYGTPLWRRMEREKRILYWIPIEDRHALKYTWFQHPHFTPYQAEKIQKEAYIKEYHSLGPSLVRWIDTNVLAYSTLSRSKSIILQRRAEMLKTQFGLYHAILWASERLVPTPRMSSLVRDVQKKLEEVNGKARWSEIKGLALYIMGKAEEIRTSLFTDVIQPKTELTHYNNGINMSLSLKGITKHFPSPRMGEGRGEG